MIRIEPSNNMEIARQFFRSYHTNDVLKQINQMSNKLLYGDYKSDIPAAMQVEYTVYDRKVKREIRIETLIAAWDLIDLAYYSIIFSNDYCGNPLKTEEQLYPLVDVIHDLRDHYIKDEFNTANVESLDNVLLLWSFAGEQFKMEMLGKVAKNVGRELNLLNWLKI